MKTVDLLIVKPGSQKQIYGDLSTFQLTAIEPPLWAALLAAHCRALDFSVDILDAEVEELSWEMTAQRICEISPSLLLIAVSGSNPSASTLNMTGAGMILKHLKELAPHIPSALQGLHPTALPERTMRDEAVDFICSGEGFFTLPGLITAIKAGTTSSTLAQTKGLWYKEGETPCFTGPAELVKDLDDLPDPAWDLLPMRSYRAHNWHCFGNIQQRQPYGVIYTSLGCPFSCDFCCINSLFGGPGMRVRSPQRVADEIERLVRDYGIRNFKLIDEMFAINETRVRELCDTIAEKHLDINLWAYARVNTVSPNMLKNMKTAGINWVGYGFESGSRRVLDSMHKNYETSRVTNVVKWTQDADINIGANFIFGLPEDDLESMEETLALALDLNSELANFYTATAYPGSKLYQQALDNKWPLPAAWCDFSPYAYNAVPLPTNYLSPAEVLKFRDDAFHTYFENPRYLTMIESKFGKITREHIQSMTKTRLRRKILE